jgi:diadenosine tetraphosphate (Ap4A) HIT family hydrolase
MANATMLKFGWPRTRIAALDHWVVQLRPQQPTLGALALVCTQPAQAFGDVDAAGFAEFGRAVRGIERMLQAAVGYERINYLMLMMVDPDVHFHVLPRYEGARRLGDLEIADAGWPGPPALDRHVAPAPEQEERLVAHLARHWPG